MTDRRINTRLSGIHARMLERVKAQTGWTFRRCLEEAIEALAERPRGVGYMSEWAGGGENDDEQT